MKNILVNSIIKKYGLSTLDTLVCYCFNTQIEINGERITDKSGKDIFADSSRRVALGKFVKMHSEHKYGLIYNK